MCLTLELCCLSKHLCVECLTRGSLGNLCLGDYIYLPFATVARLMIFTHTFLCVV